MPTPYPYIFVHNFPVLVFSTHDDVLYYFNALELKEIFSAWDQSEKFVSVYLTGLTGLPALDQAGYCNILHNGSVCPRSLVYLYLVSILLKLVKTFWTYRTDVIISFRNNEKTKART